VPKRFILTYQYPLAPPVILSVTRIRDIRLFVIELRDFVGLYMDTSPSAVAAREADLWSAAFDFSAEPLLLLDPMGIASSMGTGRLCAAWL
jgi:chemotaxis signal transduction protein